MSSELPVASLRSAFAAALAQGRVVLTSPTGSGKSTEVPRWCEGRVLVVEPRRLACRSLAARVAELASRFQPPLSIQLTGFAELDQSGRLCIEYESRKVVHPVLSCWKAWCRMS